MTVCERPILSTWSDRSCSTKSVYLMLRVSAIILTRQSAPLDGKHYARQQLIFNTEVTTINVEYDNSIEYLCGFSLVDQFKLLITTDVFFL